MAGHFYRPFLQVMLRYTNSRRTGENTLARRDTSSTCNSSAYKAEINDPMLVPPTMSIGMPAGRRRR
jgi:hypothetical protein